MQEKNLKDKRKPESRKYFSGFFIALAGLPSRCKTTGKEMFSLAGRGSFIFRRCVMCISVRLVELFRFRDANKKVLEMDLTDSTRKELEEKAKAIDAEIDKLAAERVTV
jgi:hypothetical protein